MTTSRRTPHTRRIRRGPIASTLLALLAGLCLTAASPDDQARAARTTDSYGWPVKPFNQQHPIRGYFGDPRTVFTGRPTFRNLLSGAGEFTFHFGVDISAEDGTAVYAVRSGTANLINSEAVGVSSDNGVAMQYWHIVPSIRAGQQVTAYQTVIGHIAKAAHHVHLTEIADGRPLNPLAPGHLTPYADHTTPQVADISVRTTPAGRSIAPEFLSGRVHLIAEAYDQPAMPVTSPARWRGLPVAPARIRWHIEQVKTGKVVVSDRTAFDVRSTLPRNDRFWQYYARGSHQNMLQFKTRRYWQQPGAYLFRLTRGAFDTRHLHNGLYRVFVSVADTRGNGSSSSRLITVNN